MTPHFCRCLAIAALCGCTRTARGIAERPRPPSAPRPALDQVPRADFNRFAAELDLPLFWDKDADGDGAIDPPELAVLWMSTRPTTRAEWVGGAFTDRFYRGYERVLMRKLHGPDRGPQTDEERRALVRRELDQGRPSLIRTDLSAASEAERAFVGHIVAAADIIERLYGKQRGSWDLRALLPADDPASRMLFYRNQGPWCVAPQTEGNPKCNAIPSLPKRIWGLYPAKLQQSAGFCDALKNEPNAAELRSPFTVVAERSGKLVAVPYQEAYADDMRLVAAELQAADKALGQSEPALRAYLQAAAKAFGDGTWEQADEAWAAMNAYSSKWYLRIAPDEVYSEPCSLKAAFHVSFARVDQQALKWQKLLDPLKNDMEAQIAALAGPPYAQRQVSFHLPDFIAIVLNAGDSRAPHGGTIGQSLPNFGKVAQQSRGRTVAMTNLGTDEDSRHDLDRLARSLLCAQAMAAFTTDPEPQQMTTVLHEATHNLGPANEYRVGGKLAPEIFGGPLASMLEELKAQTGAWTFTDWIAGRGLIDAPAAARAHLRDVTWAFGHISRGMVTADGQSRPYSQLAAIQVGWLVKHGALAWQADQTAANGQDKGCFAFAADRFAPAAEELMRTVAGIKARGDAAAGKQLVAEFVDAGAEQKALLDVIKQRWLRAPKASYVYAIEP